jgi:hypothetical protein
MVESLKTSLWNRVGFDPGPLIRSPLDVSVHLLSLPSQHRQLHLLRLYELHCLVAPSQGSLLNLRRMSKQRRWAQIVFDLPVPSGCAIRYSIKECVSLFDE